MFTLNEVHDETIAEKEMRERPFAHGIIFHDVTVEEADGAEIEIVIRFQEWLDKHV